MYRDGTAGAIPAADGEFAFALLSMIIHHVPDLDACARELRRVVERGGLVFIRNTFSGRLDGIRHYEFFPSARAVDEARLPRALSSFELISDTEFERGLQLMRSAADRETIPTPILERIDLLVLRAPASS